MPEPLHVKPKWLSFVSRIQGIAREHKGHAVITIRVVVDADGLPVIWSEPKLLKLEPLSSTQAWIDYISQ
jgi:hypothetical protein